MIKHLRIQTALNIDKHTSLISWLERYCTDNNYSQSAAVVEALYCLKEMTERYGTWRLALENNQYLDLLAERVVKKLDGKMITSSQPVESNGDKLDFGEDELF